MSTKNKEADLKAIKDEEVIDAEMVYEGKLKDPNQLKKVMELKKPTMYVLGIKGSEKVDPKTGEIVMSRLLVSNDIKSWLEAHDVYISAEGNRVFKVGTHVEYVYLGEWQEPQPEQKPE